MNFDRFTNGKNDVGGYVKQRKAEAEAAKAQPATPAPASPAAVNPAPAPANPTPVPESPQPVPENPQPAPADENTTNETRSESVPSPPAAEGDPGGEGS